MVLDISRGSSSLLGLLVEMSVSERERERENAGAWSMEHGRSMEWWEEESGKCKGWRGLI